MFLKRIKLGFTRHPFTFLWTTFLSFSFFWTMIEASSAIAGLRFSGIEKYILIIFLSIVSAAIYLMPTLEIDFILPTTNTKVKIAFGDLFEQHGHKVICVNEFFDSEIGELVSKNSLHGKFIYNILGNNAQIFDNAVEVELKELNFECVNRPHGKTKRYSIGTCAKLNFRDDLYYLLALCHTDLKTNKATADVPDMWQALEGLWGTIRISSNGTPVNLPIIGRGLAGIGLPSSKMVELIIISLLKYTKVKPICTQINLIILESLFEEIDLQPIKKTWS